MSKKILGYQYTTTMCRGCALDRDVADYVPPLREGDDYGVPFFCDYCGETLEACSHVWGSWAPAWNGGEISFCENRNCGEVRYK